MIWSKQRILGPNVLLEPVRKEVEHPIHMQDTLDFTRIQRRPSIFNVIAISTVNHHANNNTGNPKNQSIDPPRPDAPMYSVGVQYSYQTLIGRYNARMNNLGPSCSTLKPSVNPVNAPLTTNPKPQIQYSGNFGKWVAKSLIWSSPLKDTLSFVFFVFQLSILVT